MNICIEKKTLVHIRGNVIIDILNQFSINIFARKARVSPIWRRTSTSSFNSIVIVQSLECFEFFLHNARLKCISFDTDEYIIFSRL